MQKSPGVLQIQLEFRKKGQGRMRPLPRMSCMRISIVKYMGNFQEDLGDVPGLSFQKINSIYGVVYAPLTEVGNLNINTYSYSFIPKCYTYMDLEALGRQGLQGCRSILIFS